MNKEKKVEELERFILNYYVPEHWDLNYDYFDLDHKNGYDVVVLYTDKGGRYGHDDVWFRVNEESIRKILNKLPDLDETDPEMFEDHGDDWYDYMNAYVEDNNVMKLLCDNNIMKYQQVYDLYRESYHGNDEVYEIPYALEELIERALRYLSLH